jgi:cell division protease FtsH
MGESPRSEKDNDNDHSNGIRACLVLVAMTLLLLVVALLAFVVLAPGTPENTSGELSLSELVQQIKAGNVNSLEISDDRTLVVMTNGHRSTVMLGQSSLFKTLSNLGVTPDELLRVPSVSAKASSSVDWSGIVRGFGLTLVLLLVALVFLTQRSGLKREQLSFGKSRARRFVANGKIATFDDVAGIDDAKGELEELVEFLRFPLRFKELGVHIPKGILLCGLPGTGKTLLARALAGEAGVPFFSASGSEFVEMVVGVGASRVRDLFEEARQRAPCIVFIDEIDAVGSARGSVSSSANQEREQTLNQILVEMDGFDAQTNVIVVGATNRADLLDAALLRPGRFDRRVYVEMPDVFGRTRILEVHTRELPLDTRVNLSALAASTPGFSGADLANVANEAAILAARRNKTCIGITELEDAIDRVSGEPEQGHRVIGIAERRMLAYNSSGRALVSFWVGHGAGVRRLSLVQRNARVPVVGSEQTDRQYRAMLAAALGGRVAEGLVFGEVATISEQDIRWATDIARAMVTRYGMSQRVGAVAWQRTKFSGRMYGESTAEVIDAEVRRLLDEAYARATSLIMSHRQLLDRVADALLVRETLDADDLEQLMRADERLAA